MGFRSAQTIIRQTPGAYYHGEWAPGIESTVTIFGSVQPVGGQELMALPEGRRTSEVVKLYTDVELNTSEISQQADRMMWRGHMYEISMKAPYQSNVINHFKYYATKIQVPNDRP